MSTPTNVNMLSSLGFTFKVKKLPTVNFFATDINIPGLSMNSPSLQTPFKVINLAPDKLSYDDLAVTFKVDEDMRNWSEIANWMIGIGFPRDFDQRRILETNKLDGLKSDGSVVLLSSAKNPNIELNFLDLIPVGLSGLNMVIGNSDIDYLTATATFKFLYYTMRKLPR